MLSNSTAHHNVSGKVAYLPCSSDHEERPAIDITPSQPQPNGATNSQTSRTI